MWGGGGGVLGEKLEGNGTRFPICGHYFFCFFFIREDPIDLESGAQHIMRYSAIAPLLSNGSVSLL